MNRVIGFALSLGCLLWTACATGPLKQAMAFEASGQHLKTIDILRSSHFAEKDISPAMDLLGEAYLKLGKSRQAEKCFLKALEHDHSNADAIFHLGRLYETNGELNKAIHTYSQHIFLPLKSQLRGLIAFQLNLVTRQQIQQEIQRAIEQESASGTGPLSEKYIAVMPFRTPGNNERLRSLMKGLAEMVVTDLSQISDLKVLERIRVQALMDELNLNQTGLTDKSTAPRAGNLLKAGRVVSGTLIPMQNQNLQIKASILNNLSGKVGDTNDHSGNIRQLFKIEKDLVFSIIHEMGIQISREERDKIREVPTENLMAFLVYCTGLDYEDQGRYEEARSAFNKAISIDPQFRMPDSKSWTNLTIPVSAHLNIDVVYEKASSAENEKASESGLTDGSLTQSAYAGTNTLESIGNLIDTGFIPSYSLESATTMTDVPYTSPIHYENTFPSGTPSTVRFEAVIP